MARATATTAGLSTAGSTWPVRVTTDRAAAADPGPPRIGAATDVTGSGQVRAATATPSRRMPAS